jgi:hypothetical protein
MGVDPWGFQVESTGSSENLGCPDHDAAYCAMSFQPCTPKNCDIQDDFWWGCLPDLQTGGPKTPTRIASVSLPAVPYAGNPLQSAVNTTQWSAAVAWTQGGSNATGSSATVGTVYQAVFTITPKGKYYFDVASPPTVSVANGGTITDCTIEGDNEDGNVATMSVTVTYSAVINRPVAPPTGFKGIVAAIEILNYDPSAANTPRPSGDMTADDFVFVVEVGLNGIVTVPTTDVPAVLMLIASTKGAPLTRDEGIGGPQAIPDTETVSFTYNGYPMVGVLTPVSTGTSAGGIAHWTLGWPN